MPREVLINSTLEEEHISPLLVKICSREVAIARALSFLQDENLLFWSITISPEYNIKIRGKPKRFKDSKVNEQYYYFNHRILEYAKKSEFLINSLIVIEHNLSGNLHFHLITPKGEYEQNVKSDIIEMFDLNTRKHGEIQIKSSKVNDIYRAIAYIFKQPLDWVSNSDEIDIDIFNKNLMSKQYEISKFHTYFIQKDI